MALNSVGWRLSDEGHRKSKAYIFPPGTILISREFHHFPQVYVLKIDAAVWHSLHYIQIRKPEQLIPEYVALMLYSIREQLELFSGGSVRSFLLNFLLSVVLTMPKSVSTQVMSSCLITVVDGLLSYKL